MCVHGPRAHRLTSEARLESSMHVRAIPWPSERWRARRRLDTGHAGQLHTVIIRLRAIHMESMLYK